MRASLYPAWIAVCLAACVQDRQVVDAPPDQRPDIKATLERTRPQFKLAAPKDFYRIDLARTDGRVRLIGIERVTTQIRPMPALAPEYVLVSQRDGKAVEMMPVRFPTRAHSSLSDEQGRWLPHQTFELTDTRFSASIAADPALDRVELVDADGKSLLSIDAMQLKAAGASGRGGGDDPNSQPTSLDALRMRYPSIRFVGLADLKSVTPDLLRDGELVEIPASYIAPMAEALSKIQPALLGSIQTLGVATFPDTMINPKSGMKLRGNTGGPQIIISSELIKQASNQVAQTIAHEAAHAFDLASTDASRRWPANPDERFREDWLVFLDELNRDFHLMRGLRDAWKQLHETGIDEELAVPYWLDEFGNSVGIQPYSGQAALDGGFWSLYGSSSPGEDFAEYVRERTVPFEEELTAGPCELFRNSSGSSSEQAIHYAKLVLAAGIGAISQASFDDCIGPDYSVIPNKPGFTFSGHARRLEEGSQAGYEQGPAGPRYAVVARGLGYQLSFRVGMPDGDDSPLGLHRFASVSLSNVDAAASLDHAALFGPESRDTRASRSGFMLLTEAKDGSAKGVVFGLALQDKDAKVTDQFAYVPFMIQK